MAITQDTHYFINHLINDLEEKFADRAWYGWHRAMARDVFTRRFNILQLLLNDAPGVTPELLDGLISRHELFHQASRYWRGGCAWKEHVLLCGCPPLFGNLAFNSVGWRMSPTLLRISPARYSR